MSDRPNTPPVVDIPLEPIAESDPFGDAPTVTVQTPAIDPTAGYAPRGRWGYRQDGRPMRLDFPTRRRR
jgi:hypothetical protein